MISERYFEMLVPHMSFLQQRGKNIVLHYQITLPVKNKRVTYNNPSKNYVTVYFGLTQKQAEKLKKESKRHKKNESEIVREAIDRFLAQADKGYFVHKPLKKTRIQNLKTLPRTIHKEQDKRLRAFAEKTGRSISELVRGAIDNYLRNRGL